MWSERPDAMRDPRRTCPVMSGPQGTVLCQGKRCSAAHPRRIMGATCWYCGIIQGHPTRGEGANER